MASDDPCPEFNDLDVDIFMLKVPKQEKPSHSAALRKYYTFCRRRTFAAYVASKRAEEGGVAVWHCCGQLFRDAAGVHRHAARLHQGELQRLAEAAFQCQPGPPGDGGPQEYRPVDVCPWIPDTSHLSQEQLQRGPGQVLLYYCYCQVPEPQALCEWQKALCEKLCLTGKVRVATEGVNGTVGGSCVATALYVQAMRSHWLFTGMEEDDFKSSEGGAACFPDLRVGVFREIVPMGVDPDLLSYRLAGTHLEPEDFHREVETLVSQEGSSSSNTILLDCRNFYESKIGHFDRCLAPNIRKFSYFPDYVDQNLELFRDKKVLMYCTGGIRCERGSAYLRSKDVCKEVYQLKGGVHKYLENFPNGFYRGKLFVFDERYAISSNSDVISECRYCDAAWDQYQLCTTQVCRQLVLSCPGCRQRGRTACCPTCQAKGRGQDARGRGQGAPSAGQQPREACECTDGRLRIPQDVL